MRVARLASPQVLLERSAATSSPQAELRMPDLPAATTPTESKWCHPFRALMGMTGVRVAVAAVMLGASLLTTSCSTTSPTLPGGVAPSTQVIKSWHQGQAGNCVTVATIKSAQALFPDLAGARGVLSVCTKQSDGSYEVVMRDGFRCRLSADEVALAKSKSAFSTYGSNLGSQAHLLYACAAKRAQLEGNDGFGPSRMSYDRALASLNDGEQVTVAETFRRLGLSKSAKIIRTEDVRTYSGAILSNDRHAWFVTGGYGDIYGTPKVTGTEGWNPHASGLAIVPR